MGPDHVGGAARPGLPVVGREGGQAALPSHQPPVVDAGSLFGGGREVVIAHRGERYRLRITQSGKLILTK